MRKARSEQERIARLLDALVADQQSITREIDALAATERPVVDRGTWNMVTDLDPSSVVIRDGVQIIAGRAD